MTEKKQYAIEQGKVLFERPCTFMLGVAWLEQLPPADALEIAFAGRSNVGKSRLINALFGKRDLARASATPGRTQQLNFFDLDGVMNVVDLPGYGYAQVPEKQVKTWNDLVFTYLKGRPNLRRVYVLIDSRHGIKKVDEETMELLDKAAVTYQIVLTKTDKIGKDALAKVKTETEAEITKHAAAYTRILITSSEKRQGIDLVRAEIASLI